MIPNLDMTWLGLADPAGPTYPPGTVCAERGDMTGGDDALRCGTAWDVEGTGGDPCPHCIQFTSAMLGGTIDPQLQGHAVTHVWRPDE
jgi:hypothetical protein